MIISSTDLIRYVLVINMSMIAFITILAFVLMFWFYRGFQK